MTDRKPPTEAVGFGHSALHRLPAHLAATSSSSPALPSAPDKRSGSVQLGQQDAQKDDTYEPLEFGEFGRYMRNKRAKLQNQNKALLDPADERPQIFKGLSVYINGYTDKITLPELQHLLILHGGVYVPYLDKKGLVTHIVATNLTPSKRIEFANYKVATPDWLVDSAAAGRLKDWKEYALLAAPAVPAQAMLAEGELAPTGAQSAQRSLFGMMKDAETKQAPAKEEKHAGNNGKQKNVETIESLSARGARLAREALQSYSLSGSASSSAVSTGSSAKLQSFFQPRQPITASTTSRSGASPRRATTTGTPSRPSSPARPATADTKLPATTDSPNKPTATTSSWLPQAQRSDRMNALLQDPDWLAKHTSASEDFLAGYFAQSRLHVLSSFKEELKLLVARHYAEHPPRATAKKGKKLTGTAADGRTVMHCDLDSFFVSAGLTTRPELRGLPLAVCHARGREGGEASTSEIASCSYEARAMGVKNGMSLGRARELCPDIQTIPFEFELYKSISLKFYQILLAHATLLQVGSMDEVLMEVSVPPAVTRGSSPALALAEQIRGEIFAATGCHASIGVSHNILLARLATRKAKPAGAFHLLPEDVPAFLAPLDVDSLHGVGWAMRDKLASELGVKTVGDLLLQNKFDLGRVLGPKNAQTFMAFARGVDPRELETGKARQSVSCEVNYGIRFGEGRYDQLERFIRQLAAETAKRLREVELAARQLTLKVMVRHPDAPVEAPKMLGHGWVEVENKVSSLSGPNGATDDSTLIADVAWKLMRSIAAPPHELRGIGIQLQKLEKEGRPVDAVMERGQGTLSFGPAAPKPVKPVLPIPSSSTAFALSSTAATRSPSPSTSRLTSSRSASPRQADSSSIRAVRPSPRPLGKEPSTIVLSDSDDDDAAPAAESSLSRSSKRRRIEPGRSSPPPPPAPTRKRAAQKPEPYIPSMFRTTKAVVAPPSATASSVSDKELKKLGIAPSVFRELPLEIQREQLAAARRSLPPAKKKVKLVEPVVQEPEQDEPLDLTLSTSSPYASTSTATLPGVIVLPPTPGDAPPTETQIVKDNLGETWDFLGVRTQRQQVQAYKQREALTVKGTTSRSAGSASSSRPSAPVKDVPIRQPPRFNRKTSLDDICDVVERWVGESKDAGPDGEDVEALGRFVEKCAAREYGHDLKKAADVLSWWSCVLESECGARGKASGMGAVWWERWDEVYERLEWLVLKETGCKLRL
ncbi:hypothetical protein JCM8097_004699 [Rhodosporidiobolus ruineniae]